MENRGRRFWWTLVAGVLFLLAGLRDWLAPGFFSISGRHSSRLDIAFSFVAAALFITAALQKAVRRKADSAG